MSIEIQAILLGIVALLCTFGGALLARRVMLSTWKRTVSLMRQPRRVEVRVLPPETDSMQDYRTEGDGRQGWFVVWYESSKGWMLADVFLGEAAYVRACSEAAKLCALREENLRGEVARFESMHPGESMPLKPRDYLVLPAVVFRVMGKA